jgi:hypothetical protein
MWISGCGFGFYGCGYVGCQHGCDGLLLGREFVGVVGRVWGKYNKQRNILQYFNMIYYKIKSKM